MEALNEMHILNILNTYWSEVSTSNTSDNLLENYFFILICIKTTISCSLFDKLSGQCINLE